MEYIERYLNHLKASAEKDGRLSDTSALQSLEASINMEIEGLKRQIEYLKDVPYFLNTNY